MFALCSCGDTPCEERTEQSQSPIRHFENPLAEKEHAHVVVSVDEKAASQHLVVHTAAPAATVTWTLITFVVPLVVVSVVGFIPAVFVRATDGVWYSDAVRKKTSSPIQWGIEGHAICMLAWLGLVIHQLWGVTGQPGGHRRAAHRMAGMYLTPIIMGPGLGFAMVTAIGKTDVQKDDFGTQAYRVFMVLQIVTVAVLIIAGMVEAKRKRMESHKLCMGFAIMLSMGNGIFRFFLYAYGFLFPNCMPNQNYSFWLTPVSVFLIPALCAFLAMWRLRLLHLKKVLLTVSILGVLGISAYMTGILRMLQERGELQC